MPKKKKPKSLLSHLKTKGKKLLHDLKHASFKQKVYMFIAFTAIFLVGIGFYASMHQRTVRTQATEPQDADICIAECNTNQACEQACGSEFKCSNDCDVDMRCPALMGTCIPKDIPTPSISITLPVSPNPSLTLLPSEEFCVLKPLGDANCDDTIDLLDFNEWRVEYRALVTEKPDEHTSDIDGDGNKWDANFDSIVNNNTGYPSDLLDFSIWRDAYVKAIIMDLEE